VAVNIVKAIGFPVTAGKSDIGSPVTVPTDRPPRSVALSGHIRNAFRRH
jgi:hypothetical protein